MGYWPVALSGFGLLISDFLLKHSFSKFFVFWGDFFFLLLIFVRSLGYKSKLIVLIFWKNPIPLLLFFSLKNMSKDLITLLNYLNVVIFVPQSIVCFFINRRWLSLDKVDLWIYLVTVISLISFQSGLFSLFFLFCTSLSIIYLLIKRG